MGKLHTTYKLTITTLSPLHIGTGTILRQGYDFVTHGGKTWVFDADVLAEMLYEERERSRRFDDMVSGQPAGRLIQPEEYKPDSPLFRYILPGEVRSRGEGAELQEQIKDPWDRPYIPGSSLKGALRTALATVGWQQRKLVFDPDTLGGSAKTAAQSLEHQVLFGADLGQKTPHYDLLRALQVSDSTPGTTRDLRILNVQVVTDGDFASPIELEAVRRDVTFEATLTLDGFLLKNGTAMQLGWQTDQRQWLRNLATVVNAFTINRIHGERNRWQASTDPIRSFYETLYREMARVTAAQDEFLLQLGWGGGWDSKTFAYVLTADGQKFAQTVRKYGKTMVRKGKYNPGDRYPKSRRVIVQSEKAVMPLGWVKVRMERV
jgi:CRISPR-associated protein Csm5